MKNKVFQISLLLIALQFFVDCKKVREQDKINYDRESLLNGGYISNDDMGTVPTSISFGMGSSVNVPSSYDFTSKFPPIGNQGNFGTCVAWSCAYNAYSTQKGILNNLNVSHMTNVSNQYSPKDLYLNIDDSKKSGCEGTWFTSALDVIQTRGVASLLNVPYQMNGCSKSYSQGAWNSFAANNKIKSYRKIKGDITTIKQCLSNNIPVIFGAQVPNNFVQWNAGKIINSNTLNYSFGQPSGHAMTLSGYDDSKNAFKIVNSWGSSWADNGTAWVDYNFFLNKFCQGSSSDQKALFIMDLGASTSTTAPTTPTNAPSSSDLASWVVYDIPNGNTQSNYLRSINFNLYNIGSQNVSTSTPYAFSLIYYNAYNANDWGFLFIDEFTNTIAQNTSIQNPSNPYSWQFNYTIPIGGNFSQVVFNAPSITRTYPVPYLTGQYFIVLIADTYDALNEDNEQNNFFFTTSYPKSFYNGNSSKSNSAEQSSGSIENYKFINQNSPSINNIRSNKHNSVVTPLTPNMYSTEEISSFLSENKRNGEWVKKITEFKKQTR